MRDIAESRRTEIGHIVWRDEQEEGLWGQSRQQEEGRCKVRFRLMIQIKTHLLHVRTQSRKMQDPCCYTSIATHYKLHMIQT